jgi:hypothetical protein
MCCIDAQENKYPVDTTKKETEPFIDASKEAGLEVNERKQSTYCCLFNKTQYKILIWK